MDTRDMIVLIGVLILGGLGVWYVWRHVGNKKIVNPEIADRPFLEQVLKQRVAFFQQLKPEDQNKFISRVAHFLHTTKISPEKGAVVSWEQRILIAASATIPLFHFDTWAFENLDEVLVYPDHFDERYNTESEDRNVLGMVGDGVLHRKMILSLPALMEGFDRQGDGHTAIHEFVHLIDKADGQVDGVPEYLIPKALIQPWISEMHRSIQQIREQRSDIRPYAAKNPAEFLAVVSEYFFQRPERLETDHPKLYELLAQIYGGQTSMRDPEEMGKIQGEPDR
ncbi:MAG TPA: zinc-dependent peptidase [Candidatus Sphingobacterium stercorigallinarum]|nr:zinc-dependent peptidase [Candidatus Sphingobacterium stercorigallinarum]